MTKAYFKTKQNKASRGEGGGGEGRRGKERGRRGKDSDSVRIKCSWSACKAMPPPPTPQLWQWALYTPPLYSNVDDGWSHSVFSPKLTANEELNNIRLWLQANEFSLNITKTECSTAHVNDSLSFPYNQMYALEEIRSKKSNNPKSLEFRLISLNESITWSKHVEEITKNITAGINALKWSRCTCFSL